VASQRRSPDGARARRQARSGIAGARTASPARRLVGWRGRGLQAGQAAAWASPKTTRRFDLKRILPWRAARRKMTSALGQWGLPASPLSMASRRRPPYAPLRAPAAVSYHPILDVQRPPGEKRFCE
jgi:hypothetical protein